MYVAKKDNNVKIATPIYLEKVYVYESYIWDVLSP